MSTLQQRYRRITVKVVQVYQYCSACCTGVLYPDQLVVRYKDFKKRNIKRRIDKATKKPFLTIEMHLTECENCQP